MLYKINAELQYARADVKMGEGEQITIARKRVKWLEDRMAMLCGKNRRLVRIDDDDIVLFYKIYKKTSMIVIFS